MYDDNFSFQKDLHNKLIVEVAYCYLIITGIILLDGEEMRTTFEFIKKKTNSLENNRYEIYIPETNEETHHRHKTLSLCNAYHGSLWDFLHELHEKDQLKLINLVYFDFTSTPFGNDQKHIYPMSDIKFYLQNNGNEKVVIAITFCLRKEELRGNKDKQLKTITDRFVKPCIEYCGYKIVGTRNESHYNKNSTDVDIKISNMVFLLYELEHDANLKDVTIPKFRNSYRGYRKEDKEEFKMANTIKKKINKKRGIDDMIEENRIKKRKI